MFPTSKLFSQQLCPDYPDCPLSPCLFSHVNPRTIAPPRPASRVPKKRSLSPSDERGSKVAKGITPGVKSDRAPVASTSRNAYTGPKPVLVKPSAGPTQEAASSSGPAGPSRPLTPLGAAIWRETLVDTGPPRIEPGAPTHTPLPQRQKLLKVIYDQFLLSYADLPDKPRAKILAGQHAKEQEATIHSKSNKATYRNSVISALARLKKRVITCEEDTGTLEREAERAKETDEKEKGTLTRERLGKFVSKKDLLVKYDYLVLVPDGPGGDQPTEEGNIRKCERCAVEFLVSATPDWTGCSYHFGRMVTEVLGGIKTRVWSCCPTPNALPCQQGPHVFKDEDITKLHARIPFLTTSTLLSTTAISVNKGKKKHDILALDCELVYTTSGMALARLTVVDHEGGVVLDELVKPQGTVLDLNTRFSGVKEDDVKNAKVDVESVRVRLGELMSEQTILIGHGLENDLKALRLVHTTVIDTAIIFTHPRGVPWRHALRNLTRDHLGKFIQTGGAAKGHSAVEDSRSALELVRWKMRKEVTNK